MVAFRMLGHKAKHQRFAVEYAKDLDAPAAARRAGYSEGYAENATVVLLGNPRINKLVARELRYARNCAGLTNAKMISHLISVVDADPSRISWVETRPCLNCYSDEDREAYRPLEASMGPMDKPNPNCKLCRGVGVMQTRLADTRTLTRGERELLLGYKTDKDGNISVKIKDKTKELAALLEIMKLTTPGGITLNVTGVNGQSMDTEALMKKNPKDMTTLELELAMRIEKTRLEARTIEGR